MTNDEKVVDGVAVGECATTLLEKLRQKAEAHPDASVSVTLVYKLVEAYGLVACAEQMMLVWERMDEVGAEVQKRMAARDELEQQLQAQYYKLRHEFDVMRLGYTDKDDPPNIGNKYHFGPN